MIELVFELFIVAEVAISRRGDVIYLVESVGHKLLFEVVRALKTVIVVSAVLHEATGEDR